MAADPITNLRFWSQILEDGRRTIICPAGLGDRVRALLDAELLGGLYDVQESPYLEGHILIMDHNVMEASTRQAFQRLTKKGLYE